MGRRSAVLSASDQLRLQFSPLPHRRPCLRRRFINPAAPTTSIAKLDGSGT